MRLAVVTNLATHYRAPLFRELAARFETVFFLTGAGRGKYAIPEYEVAPLGLEVQTPDPRVRVVPAIRGGNFGCVLATLTDRVALPLAYLAARSRGLPFVLWVGIWEHPHTPFHRVSRPFARALYRRADALVVYGSHVAEFVAREAGRTAGVFIAPQAVDNDAFRKRPEEGLLIAARRDLPDDALMALYIGRLEAGKGLDDLVGALLAAPGWHLSLVGSGALADMLRELARESGLESRVHFHGYVAQGELSAHLYGADALVLPSVSTPTSRETWGLVVNEAMNAGLPVVVTDAVGAAAGGLVVDGATGLVVGQRRPAELAAALRTLGDADLRRRLGAGGRERVLGFSFASAADGIEAAIRWAVAT